MTINDIEKDCQKSLEKLIDKKIMDVKYKSYNNNCWRLHIDTDKGKMIITFCKDWKCPMVEYKD